MASGHSKLGLTVVLALIHPLGFLLSQGRKEDIVKFSIGSLRQWMLQLLDSVQLYFSRILLRRQSIGVLPFCES